MDTAALKVIAAFLAAAMTVSLAACSTKTGADGSEKIIRRLMKGSRPRQ